MRLFVAVPVPEALGQALFDAARPYETNLPLRWVPLENLHLTTLFLGDGWTPAQAEMLALRIRAGLPELSAFEAPVEAIDLFPDGRNPAVLVALFGRNLMLQALHDEVWQLLKGVEGVDKPRQRFRPHISLARPRGRPATPPSAVELADADLWLPVEEVVLYRSDFRPEGVRYRPLARGRLA